VVTLLLHQDLFLLVLATNNFHITLIFFLSKGKMWSIINRRSSQVESDDCECSGIE